MVHIGQLNRATRRLPLLSGEQRGETLILDECSMVDVAMLDVIRRSGVNVIAFGDPENQLLPVDGLPAFTHADFVLTEVHRQAINSAAVRQATVRRTTFTGRGYSADGDDFKFVTEALDHEFAEYDVVLCWQNPTRHLINRKVRTLRGFDGDYPAAGELVCCLKNAWEYDVQNGQTFIVAVPYDPAEKIMRLIAHDGRLIEVPDAQFGATLDKSSISPRATSAFTFGYCLTVHKSQGSEWPAVMVIDEYPFWCAEDRRRWVYTGITRARQSVMMVREFKP
jgi:exodeoxyribonuclease-5